MLPTCEEIGTPVNARVRLANATGIEPVFTVLEAVRVPDPSTYWDVSPSVQSRFGATVLPLVKNNKIKLISQVDRPILKPRLTPLISFALLARIDSLRSFRKTL